MAAGIDDGQATRREAQLREPEASAAVMVGHHWQWGMLDGDGPPNERTVSYCVPLLARLKVMTPEAGMDAVRASGVAVARRSDAHEDELRAFELAGLGPLAGKVALGIDRTAGISTLRWRPDPRSASDRIDALLWVELRLEALAEALRSSEPLHLFGRARPPAPADGHLRSSGETPLVDDAGRARGAITSLDIDVGGLLHASGLPDRGAPPESRAEEAR